MWTSAATAACTIFVAFLAPELGFAQCATTVDTKCTSVEFLDPLQISECLDKTWNICSGSEKAQTESINNLARCLTQSGAFARLMFIFVDGIREATLFLLDLVFPGSARALSGPSYRPPVIRHTVMPEGCKHKINVSVPEHPGIKKCSGLVVDFCRGFQIYTRHRLAATLVGSLVCILKNIPPAAASQLLKEFTCNLLENVIGFLQQAGVAPLLRHFLQLIRVVLNCDVYNPRAE